MLLLRIVAPADLAPAVVAYLDGLGEVTDLVHVIGAARRPVGDLIQCVVALASASAVVSALDGLGVPARGSITLDRLDAAVSHASTQAAGHSPGAAADAVVWEEVEARTATTSEMSIAYLVYMMAATILASIAILTDSIILIMGAMVVGPEFGPLSGLCVGLVRRRAVLVRQALISLGVGFLVALLASLAATWIFREAGMAPAAFTAALHPETLFISQPDGYAVVVAAIAGVVGMLSLTTASSGTLIGILISATTFPAAANAGVSAAYGNTSELVGSLAQLGINLAAMIIAGLLTLRLQHAAFIRRVARLVDRVARRATLGRAARR